MSQFGNGFGVGNFYASPFFPLGRITINENLTDEVKQAIEEHKDEFRNEKELREFIRIQSLKQ